MIPTFGEPELQFPAKLHRHLGLELRNAYQSYNFTDNTGKAQTYNAFAASLYIDGASNITIQNCTLDSSGLGLFALTNNGLITSNLLVEGNYFYNNGVPRAPT